MTGWQIIAVLEQTPRSRRPLIVTARCMRCGKVADRLYRGLEKRDGCNSCAKRGNKNASRMMREIEQLSARLGAMS